MGIVPTLEAEIGPTGGNVSDGSADVFQRLLVGVVQRVSEQGAAATRFGGVAVSRIEVVARLEKGDPVVLDMIDQAVFLGNPS